MDTGYVYMFPLESLCLVYCYQIHIFLFIADDMRNIDISGKIVFIDEFDEMDGIAESDEILPIFVTSHLFHKNSHIRKISCIEYFGSIIIW